MGVQKSYFPLTKKWALSGWNVIRYYDSEEEADADYNNVLQIHQCNIHRNMSFVGGVLRF